MPAERVTSGRVKRPRLVPLRQPAGDDLGHAVAGHRHAVERVGGLHRALLVRDHDELRAVRGTAQEREEAVDVEVVERRLDLVEDVERARPGEEDGEQEGERSQRLLAAGEQRQALGRLAGRGDLDLDAERSSSGASSASAAASASSSSGAGSPPSRAAPAAEHRTRARVFAHEPQRARGRRGTGARRRSSKFARRGGERLLERLADAGGRSRAIRLCSSRSAVSRSSRWRSSSSTWATRLVRTRAWRAG